MKNMSDHEKWAVIGRGKAGWHAAGSGRYSTSSSGGQLEDYTYWTGEKCKGYLSEALEGCVVYDASEADECKFIRHVISGPMLQMDLGDGADRFGPDLREAAERMRPGLEGAFGTITDLALAGYSSLDKVGWPVYRKLLEQCGKVRFGVVKGGKVEWEP